MKKEEKILHIVVNAIIGLVISSLWHYGFESVALFLLTGLICNIQVRLMTN